MSTIVLATAGHVDHGKSTLVKALTGMHPDRLSSEQSRGLTIELGFAWSEIGEHTFSFVDVPGHEKFIATMLAGIGSVPAALLVVAADDPWMPQTAEHLAALEALGVEHGVVAITRSDLRDPASAQAEVGERLADTSLAGSAIVPVSALTGHGMDQLRQALIDLAAGLPTPDPSSDVRMWIDRAFTITGAGTVITGTLPAGTLRVGQTLMSGGGPVKIRGIESLNQARKSVVGPARVALNLTGALENISRGQPLWQEGHWWQTSRVEVRLTGSGELPRSPVWHVGGSAQSVQVRPIDDNHVQLLAGTPLPLRQGDRTILRDPGDRRLWGALVVAPDASVIRGASARGDRAQALAARGDSPSLDAELDSRGVAHPRELRRLGILVDGDQWMFSHTWKQRVQGEIDRVVRAHDAANPANPGLAPAAVLDQIGYTQLPGAMVQELLPQGLSFSAGKVTSAATQLPERVEQALEELNKRFASPFDAPTLEELRELGLTPQDLGAAARLKKVFMPAPGVVLPPRALTIARELLSELPGPFTTSEARQALGTSRRVAIPILEFFDRAGLTRRGDDDRREFTVEG